MITSVACSVERSLVCMSSHGHGMLTSALLGSVSTAVLASTSGPLLMVGPKAGWGTPETPVVVCVDGSEVSHQSLPTARAWAARLGAGVTLVTVAESVPASTTPGERHYQRMFGPDIDADRYLAEVAARFSQPAPPMATHAIYDPLGPAEGLVGYLAAHPARLVVLTTRARTGAPHPYLGRAAAQIVRSCPAPVLLQRPIPSADDARHI
jgi:nucleotide-binding universal stress UspA family protein